MATEDPKKADEAKKASDEIAMKKALDAIGKKSTPDDAGKKKTPEELAKAATKTWITALAITSVVGLAGGFFFARYTTSDRASLVIASLILGAMVWGGFYFVFDLKKDNIKSGASFLAVFCFVVGGALTGYSLQLSDAEQAFTEKQEKERAAEAAKAALAARAEQAATASVNKTGDGAEFERMANAYINRLSVIRTEYLHELDGTGWQKVLDTERVRLDKNLADSRAMVQKAKDVITKYRLRHLALLEDTLKEIATLKVTEPSRQKILRSFDSSSPNSQETTGLVWDAESNSVAAYEGIFTLLAARKGTWSAAPNGKILFTSQADLDAFNGYLSAIQATALKGEELRKLQRETIDNTMNEPKPAPPEAKGPPADAKAAPVEVKSTPVEFKNQPGTTK